jgi:hypothetical protein
MHFHVSRETFGQWPMNGKSMFHVKHLAGARLFYSIEKSCLTYRFSFENLEITNIPALLGGAFWHVFVKTEHEKRPPAKLHKSTLL